MTTLTETGDSYKLHIRDAHRWADFGTRVEGCEDCRTFEATLGRRYWFTGVTRPAAHGGRRYIMASDVNELSDCMMFQRGAPCDKCRERPATVRVSDGKAWGFGWYCDADGQEQADKYLMELYFDVGHVRSVEEINERRAAARLRVAEGLAVLFPEEAA